PLTYTDHPVVAVLNDGSYVVAWDNSGSDGSYHGIVAQRYVSGVGQGTFTVNTTTAGEQFTPSIAALSTNASGGAAGGFVVSWSGPPSAAWDVFAQRFDASGNKVGGEIAVTTNPNLQLHSTVTGLTGGGFVVTWYSNDTDGSNQNIYGRVYDATGTAVGSEFEVNAATVSTQVRSEVTGLTDGSFVVTWDSYVNGYYQIEGQRYDASGSKIGGEFTANATITTIQQQLSWVTADANGGFTISW